MSQLYINVYTYDLNELVLSETSKWTGDNYSF